MIKAYLSSRRLLSLPIGLFLGGLTLPATALAQEEIDDESMDEADFEEEDDSLSDLDEEEEGEELGTEGESAPAEELLPPPVEKKKGETQLLMGLRYRALITPKFLMNMFGVDGGATILVNGVGPEIGGYWGARDDGFMVMFSPWIAYYNLDQTPFKSKSDGDDAWEIIESDLKVWYLTIDAMWDHKIMDRFSFMVGGGFGLGIVGGELRRQEAYVTGPGDGNIPDLALCGPPIAPGAPGTPNGSQCPADGNYDITGTTTSDAWPVYPWINFQAGLRYQPVDEFIARFDFGVGSSGFWLGLGADYSLFL